MSEIKSTETQSKVTPLTQAKEKLTSNSEASNKTLHLYWFSGSGNTLRLVETFASRLRQLGWTVELRGIEGMKTIELDENAVFGLAFPTHCFSIPGIVRRFISRIPKVSKKTRAIYLGSHGAVSFGVRGHLKTLLQLKGFQCLSGRIIRMPDSYFPFFSARANRRRISIGIKQTKQYADQFNSGRAGWFRLPLISDLAEILLASFFACRRVSSLTNTSVHPRKKRCIGCDRCVAHCPVQALKLDENAVIEVPEKQCINCLRCVAICPTDAMRHLIGFSPYRGEYPADLAKRLDRGLGKTEKR